MVNHKWHSNGIGVRRTFKCLPWKAKSALLTPVVTQQYRVNGNIILVVDSKAIAVDEVLT